MVDRYSAAEETTHSMNPRKARLWLRIRSAETNAWGAALCVFVRKPGHHKDKLAKSVRSSGKRRPNVHHRFKSRRSWVQRTRPVHTPQVFSKRMLWPKHKIRWRTCGHPLAHEMVASSRPLHCQLVARIGSTVFGVMEALLFRPSKERAKKRARNGAQT